MRARVVLPKLPNPQNGLLAVSLRARARGASITFFKSAKSGFVSLRARARGATLAAGENHRRHNRFPLCVRVVLLPQNAEIAKVTFVRARVWQRWQVVKMATCQKFPFVRVVYLDLVGPHFGVQPLSVVLRVRACGANPPFWGNCSTVCFYARARGATFQWRQKGADGKRVSLRAWCYWAILAHLQKSFPSCVWHFFMMRFYKSASNASWAHDALVFPNPLKRLRRAALRLMVTTMTMI